MKLVWTRGWARQPKPYFYFRIGNDSYVCRYKIWYFVLIERSSLQ